MPIILILVSCQPSELERCIEANKSKIDIDEYLLKSELEIVSNDKLKQQWIKDYETNTSLEINNERRNYLDDVESGFFERLGVDKDTGIPDLIENLGDLSKSVQNNLNVEDDLPTYNVFNLQRHLNYNKEYYGIPDRLVLTEAEAICNAQGVY